MDFDTTRFGLDPAEWDLWTAYEAVFNRSFAHLPAWVLCSYDANGTPDRILDGVRQTHPEVVDGEAWSTSGRYEDPDERLARELGADGVPEAKVLETLLAATEVFANAEQHGGGVEDVRVGRVDGRLVCEIVDRGEGFDDPAAGYLAPREGTGSGLWVARQLTWQIELFRAPTGFTARIWL